MSASAETPAPTQGNVACSRCGSTERSPKSANHCKCGAMLPGNRAAAIIGQHGAAFWREHARTQDEMVDELLADFGYRGRRTPLTVRISAIALARSVIVADRAYMQMVEAGGPMSESGKPRRAYTVWKESNDTLMRDLRSVLAELVAAQPPEETLFGIYSGKTTQELFDLAVNLAEQLNALIAGNDHSAVLDGEAHAHLPTLETRPVSEPAFSRSLDTAEPNSGREIGLGRQFSSPSDRDPGREFASSLAPPASPEPDSSGEDEDEDASSDPTPDLWADGIRVTEAHVRRCLADVGDLAAYDSGRISTDAAYRRTQTWLRNLRRMR